MTTVLAPRTTRRRERAEHGAWPSLFGTAGGEPTLDELLSGLWEGLTAHKAVDCPICGGEMEPRYGVHALPIAGSCSGCGTQFG